MPVPLLDVNAQNLPLECEFKEAFERVLKSGQFILGPEIEHFEKQLATLLNVRHAISVSSGTDAILLALMALDIKAGDEVICPSFTFFATAGCIARTGATPVFVDSDPNSFNLNPQALMAKITQRTKVILPVHLFGQSVDLEPILRIAREHNLLVIEDAAQALGATYRDRSVGTFGAFGTFSFFPSKNLGGFGDSGLVSTNDDDLAEKAKLLRTHGSKPKYFHKVVGANFRMDPLQAALLAVKLPHYQSYSEKRRANADYYTNRLSALEGVQSGEMETVRRDPDQASEAKIILPSTSPDSGHIWNQYTLRVLGDGRRDQLKTHLTNLGIGTEIYYPVPLHQQECFAYLRSNHLDFPVANQLAREVLSIPIYPELSDAQKDEVIAGIGSFLIEH